VFDDRHDAGRRLAPLLDRFAGERPVVVALPRGGVPVAAEVARALDAPLDLLMVRKIGAPGQPEFGIGALAEDGSAVLDTVVARRLEVTEDALERIIDREAGRIRHAIELFRGGRDPADVRGRTVVVVDDGVATGLTDLAAVRALRAGGAARIVVAVPVGSPQGLAMLRGEADEVVCHTVPRELMGVGNWYRDFGQVSDDEVLAELAAAAAHGLMPAPDGVTGGARELLFDVGGVPLRGDLAVPADATGLVVFAHGSGSSRRSPRNRAVARRLRSASLATLLLDLLAEDEEGRRDLVFDIPVLAARLEAVTRRARDEPEVRGLPVGFFGASTGAGAALRAAAALGDDVRAVVSRGGRPDLASERLPLVRAATLLIVGSRDPEVLQLNRRAAARLTRPHRVEVVEGATHLFEEPGTLDAVADLAIDWFVAHLPAVRAAAV
jgi:putative phosphoribosyl transferase